MKQVAVVGASGYTGREVLRVLRGHPGMTAGLVMTARPDHEPEPPAAPWEQPLQPLQPERFVEVDGVFLCTPHGTAAELAQSALVAGCKVVDLSADFRLRDPRVYAETYGAEHPAPRLLAEAVYGLTEHARPALAGARLVANPGCYPTSVLLPLLPLLQEGLLEDGAAIVADSKSGISGAGKTPSERTHFGNVQENFLAYGVGGHRHEPEIWQEAGTEAIAFVPHLLPVFRGILTTLYLTPRRGIGADDVTTCLRERYAGEPFVRVLSRGLPELRGVQRTNECHMAVATVGPQVVVLSAIDNLVKGAAGQAVQNMNRLLDLPEGEGLR